MYKLIPALPFLILQGHYAIKENLNIPNSAFVTYFFSLIYLKHFPDKVLQILKVFHKYLSFWCKMASFGLRVNRNTYIQASSQLDKKRDATEKEQISENK